MRLDVMPPGKPTTGRAKKGSFRSGRSKKLCIRISEEDLHILGRLAQNYGLTKSDFVIELVRLEAQKWQKNGLNLSKICHFVFDRCQKN